MKKICKGCGKEKDLDRGFYSYSFNGTVKFKPVCKECITEIKAAERAKDKAEKSTVKKICKRCGVAKSVIDNFFKRDATHYRANCKACTKEAMGIKKARKLINTPIPKRGRPITHSHVADISYKTFSKLLAG